MAELLELITNLQVHDYIGITGSFIVLITYFLLNSGKLSSQTIIYPTLNIIASSFLLISLSYNWNTPSVLIEIFWLFISLYGLCRQIYLRRK